MVSVLDTCQPSEDILAGTFNPEIFTASLAQVLDFYAGKRVGIDAIYTDPALFFGQGTYPTAGLRTVLREAFGRLAGDRRMPALHTLATAFGGGKTHTLIACVHLA
jgi:predicted AAA+ superfamily ATPase